MTHLFPLGRRLERRWLKSKPNLSGIMTNNSAKTVFFEVGDTVRVRKPFHVSNSESKFFRLPESFQWVGMLFKCNMATGGVSALLLG